MRHTVAALLVLILTAGAAPTWARGKAKPRVLRMEATAYSQEQQLTAAGTEPREGIVAADPRVLPLGSRIQVRGAGPYDGYYLVADTGKGIKGREIDIYLESDSEAKRFGRKNVKVHVLEVGEGRKDAREKEEQEQSGH